MKRLGFIILLCATQVSASSILLIGDSHTAGPFGKKLHQLLSKKYDQVVTLGHASSSAYHWMSQKPVALSGGKFNQLSMNQKQYLDPQPVHWRQKTMLPKFEDVLLNNAYHTSWQNSLGQNLTADLVVVALGANDARTIADSNGSINPKGWEQRRDAILNMLVSIKRSRAKCIWILPPDGIKKSPQNQATLYRFLRDTIAQECSLMSSLHYKVTGCDGIHFSCSSQKQKAYQWAAEAFSYVQSEFDLR